MKKSETASRGARGEHVFRNRRSCRVSESSRETGLSRIPCCALVAAVLLATALSACKTASEGDGAGPNVPMMPFVPVGGHAQIHWIEGRYPNLLDPSSFAVWPGMQAPILQTPVLQTTGLDAALAAEEASPAAQETGPIPDAGNEAPPETLPVAEMSPVSDTYLDIECRIASMFADTSIAYDVAGLRGVNVYLLLPDGTKQRPAQVQRGTELVEEARGALRYFARTNHLIFPLRAMNLAVPADGSGEQSVRLVLEGYGAVFAFVWPARPSGLPPQESAIRERAGAAREGVRGAWGTVKRVGHTFD